MADRGEMRATSNESSLRIWTETAPFWTKHRSFVDAVLGPITPVLVEEAGIAPGSSILDVAGGAGEPSLTIARIVGAPGRVVCTDAVEAMVAAARAETSPRQRGLRPVRGRGAAVR